MTDPADELVEVVDLDGTVLDVVTRAAIRAGVLRHRCTYVVVTTSDRHLVVHQRAEWKDVYPGWWDVAFGGICDVAEPWDVAARRELLEEAGLAEPSLEPLGSLLYEADDGRVLGRVYHVVSDTEPSCPDGEVVAVDRVPLDHLAAWLDGRSVCHDSRQEVVPLVAERFGLTDLLKKS